MYHSEMKQIIDNEIKYGGWKTEWDESMKSHPETCNFKYNLLVNSKSYFLYNTTVCF